MKGVRSLTHVKHWHGTESMHQIITKVPDVVLAQNIFMHGVDQFDQLHASHTKKRYVIESRVSMCNFAFFIDATAHNDYALYCVVIILGKYLCIMPYCKFRSQTCEAFIAPLLDHKQQNLLLSGIPGDEYMTEASVHQCDESKKQEKPAFRSLSIEILKMPARNRDAHFLSSTE